MWASCVGFRKNGLKASGFKSRFCVARHADDPFLIDREVIWQRRDWPNKNLVSIQVKLAKTSKTFVLFHCHFTPPSIVGQKGIKMKYFTIHKNFCRQKGINGRFRIKHIRGTCRYQPSRAQSLVSYWPQSGGVLRSSGRPGVTPTL